MRVLVTGCAGFIGHHVTAALLESGHPVVGIDDFSTGDPSNLHTGCEFVEGSILDSDLLSRAIAQCEAVVHLAAIPSVPRSLLLPRASYDVNVTGTLSVLEAARAASVRNLIFASSSSVYGANESLPKHEGLAPLPMSPYAAGKLAAENHALTWQRCFGLGVLAFRFFNVFGPRQRPDHAYAAVVPSFLNAAARDSALRIFGTGAQTRDFTYVGSVARVILRAIESRTTCPGPVNLAFGSRTSLNDLASEIGRVVARPLRIEYEDARPGDVLHSQADSRLLDSLFPDVAPVSLRDGLVTTMNWMTSYLAGSQSR
ncbi:MAG: NAD-dependent epimerase/dehydratase family protein [Acidimicrobiia bacterium]